MNALYRLATCKHCGAILAHASTGRPRRFCSTRCRVAHGRAMRRWAHQAVDAILAGEPEPVRPGCYETHWIRVEVGK